MFVEPNLQHKSTLKLVSKYPLCSYTAIHTYRMKGGKFQGANQSNFSDVETLYTIDYYPLYQQEININNEKEFRYYRYVAPEKTIYGFSELYFFTANQSDTLLMQGHYFDEYYSNPQHFLPLTDDNLVTYVTGVPGKGNWIGYDSGRNKKTRLAKIRFAPQNDANCIIPGQVYELLHWEKNQWNSLGKQQASCFFLEYVNAPQGALFWLRCHSEGKEERIFTYEKGKQVWW